MIVTSSVDGLDNIVHCVEQGAADYIPKPVNNVLLNARVGACLEKKKLLQRFAKDEVAQGLMESRFSNQRAAHHRNQLKIILKVLFLQRGKCAT